MPDDPSQGFEFHAVHPGRWPDLERLFESRGAPRHCWCMAFRAAGAGLPRNDRGARKAAMHRCVSEGIPVGILAYRGGEPVAWCSIAPRETCRRIRGLRTAEDVPGTVWSLACFYVVRPLRRQGLTARLIEAAVAYARAEGARTVEAYPVDPDAPSYRFMGFVERFRAAGFREVGRAGLRRHVMRLQIG